MTAPTPSKHRRSACLISAVLLASTAFVTTAHAAGETDATPQAKYRTDVAYCKSGQSNQDEATCIKEAGAALEEAKRHRLSNGQTSYDQDQLKRCQALPADKQEDCMALMSGQGKNTTQGSVGGGGVLRETVITVPATPGTSEPPATPGTASPAPVN